MPKTVALNMIVKNEGAIIERCLDRVLPWIDYWVIVDTGSTDDTREKIRAKLENVPGELHERPWVNFGHNRTEALRLALDKADWILLTDADMMFEVNDPGWKDQLEGEALMVEQRHGEEGYRYRNVRLIDARLDGPKRWLYRGATHEFIDSEDPGLNDRQPFDGVSFLDLDDGGAKADKFERDAKLLAEERERLTAELETETDERMRASLEMQLGRACFYLGRSYAALQDWPRTIEAYRARAAMGGWADEVFSCHLEIGRALERMGAPEREAMEAYLLAFEAAPHRAESLCELQRMHGEAGRHHLAFLYGETAIRLPEPDGIFVERIPYLRTVKDLFAISAFWVGRYELSARLCRELLAQAELPSEDRQRIEANLGFAQQKLRERAASVHRPAAKQPRKKTPKNNKRGKARR